MKKLNILSIIFLSILLGCPNISMSQVRVNSYGQMEITAALSDWGTALCCNVSTPNSISYTLHDLRSQQDVAFTHASGYLWTKLGGFFGSDSTYKKNISDIQSPLEKILSLRGCRYQYKLSAEEQSGLDTTDPGQGYRYGFIAQEVVDVLPEVIKVMPTGKLSMSYADVVAVLVEAMKEQQKMIDTLMTLLPQNKMVNNQVKEGNRVNGINEIADNDIPTLYQNAPNPFSSESTIRLYAPKNANSVQLCIYNATGELVECTPIQDRGNTSVVLQGSTLNSGIYVYVLIVDGEIVDSKHMVLTK